MKLSNKTYDFLKYLTTIFAPALTALIAGLGTLGLFPSATVVVAVIGLVATFVGQLINSSSKQYHEDNTEDSQE